MEVEEQRSIRAARRQQQGTYTGRKCVNRQDSPILNKEVFKYFRWSEMENLISITEQGKQSGRRCFLFFFSFPPSPLPPLLSVEFVRAIMVEPQPGQHTKKELEGGGGGLGWGGEVLKWGWQGRRRWEGILPSFPKTHTNEREQSHAAE